VTGVGALLAFRQDAATSSTTIALRNVPPGRRFVLRSAPSGAFVGQATSDELRAGLTVSVPAARGASVVIIEPA
jgi:hypothetical protein